MPASASELLPAVIAVVEQAGAMLAAEFIRPGGPRFADSITAPIDREIELLLRDRLRAALPARFVGEEAGILAGPDSGFCWLVDPHDGTRAFLEGRRGSAVSVALLRRSEPVLGVVFAPLSPDRGADLIAWAEGLPITRNGVAVQTDLRRRTLDSGAVVFLNHGAWQRPVWQGIAVAPGRFMPLPSIAYRLARVAAGDGVATVTLRPVNALDIAAGHALVRAAGGVLLAEDGAPVTYSEQGESRPSACFGGAPAAVRVLLGRQFRGSTELRRAARVQLDWPRCVDERRLDRAVGCLLGQAIGDSLGAQVEFCSARDIAARFPDGVRELRDGGVWNTLAGQPTDDTELALALARSLAGRADHDAGRVAGAYARWFASGPFDCGTTTRQAFAAAAAAGDRAAEAARAAADRASQSNGSLMRAAPVGVWSGDPGRAAAAAAQDSALSHPHPVCVTACAAYAAAIAAGVDGADRVGMLRAALDVAARAGRAGAAVLEALRRAERGIPPAPLEQNIGWVLPALHNAFVRLAVEEPAGAALVGTIAAGGDTDTNAAIAGALLGAAEGRGGFPAHWVMPVLTCRPEAGLGVPRPRPEEYWPDDLVDLAEALLASRG